MCVCVCVERGERERERERGERERGERERVLFLFNFCYSFLVFVFSVFLPFPNSAEPRANQLSSKPNTPVICLQGEEVSCRFDLRASLE